MSTALQRRSAAACKAAATRKRMAAARGATPKCSRCGGERDLPTQAYCRSCKAADKRGRSLIRRGISRETEIVAGFMSEAA